MDFTAANWLGVVLATVASMALGAGWYMVLANPWMAATGKPKEELMGSGGSIAPFAWAAICQLIMAYFLAIMTPALFGDTTVLYAVQTGAIVWFAFILTSMVLNHRYQNQRWTLTVIDGGYLLGVMLLQGLVIGLFG